MVTFDFADAGFVRIRVHYDHRDKCQSIPGGRWIAKDKVWEYLLTPATAACICQTFFKEITAEDRLRLQEVSDRLYHAQRTKDQNATLVAPVTKTPPWNHQIVSYNMAKELFGLTSQKPCGGGAMLGLDMGPQPLDAKILTPTGWEEMGCMKVGDFVIGSNGTKTKITNITPFGKQHIYEVFFSDGAKTKCTQDHLWAIITPRDKWQDKDYRVFPLSHIQNTPLRNTSPKNTYWKWFIPMVSPVHFEHSHPLSIDPYLLGVLLGDGGLTQTITFTTADSDILDEVMDILSSEYSVHQYSQYTYSIVYNAGHDNPMLRSIRDLHLNTKSENKHIPNDYLFSSIQDRTSLLQGLFDTDGYVHNAGNCIEYSSSSIKLARDVQMLVRSLGGTATMTTKKTKCLDSYRLYVKLPNNIVPFRLRRKFDKYNGILNPTRSIRKIAPCGITDVQCITVEAQDGLYVTDDFIVTHNCGKSKVAVDLIANYPGIFKKVLVVCPASVIDVWAGNEDRKGQFEIHCPDDVFKKMTIHPVKGLSVEKKTKAAETARFVALSQGRQFIAVINYESAWREPFATWAKDVGFDLVVLDECHRIKSPGGKASKYFGQLARTTRFRLGLTGTPLPHSPLDIYGQYRFLDPGIFGTSFSKFRGEYAVMGGFQGHQILNYRNTDTLHNKMFLIAHRVMSKDVFDLPKFQSEVRTCELSPAERKVYQEMDINFCAQVANGEVTAANALVKLLRLQEITSGYLDAQPIGDSKKKLLADVLEDFDQREPLVIFARFTNDLRAIKEVAESQGRTYAELSGHANELSQWQIGNKDVLGVQIKSGREGVDFTRARYSIYYSLGFSLGDYEQSIKRLDRPGQVREGMYIHLLVKNTVDFKVMEALEKRQEVVSSVLNQYKGVNDFGDVPEIDDVPDMQEAAFP